MCDTETHGEQIKSLWYADISDIDFDGMILNAVKNKDFPKALSLIGSEIDVFLIDKIRCFVLAKFCLNHAYVDNTSYDALSDDMKNKDKQAFDYFVSIHNCVNDSGDVVGFYGWDESAFNIEVIDSDLFNWIKAFKMKAYDSVIDKDRILVFDFVSVLRDGYCLLPYLSDKFRLNTEILSLFDNFEKMNEEFYY